MKTIFFLLLSIATSPLASAAPLNHNGGSASASLAANQWAYFKVTVPSGNEGWRLTLNATGPADPHLYVLRGTTNPTTGSYTKASTNETTDTFLPTAIQL